MGILTRNFTDISWKQMLNQSGQETLVEFCKRLGIQEEWKCSGAEPSVFLTEYFLNQPELFSMMLSEEEFDLLLYIWDEQKVFDLGHSDRKNLLCLEKLGFLQYHPKLSEIAINKEAKDNFYFSFKSIGFSDRKKQYQELEYGVKGILYVYGVADLSVMYDIIKEKYPIPYEDFQKFLIVRMSLWNFLGILRNTQTQVLYAISYEVKDRRLIFYRRKKEQTLDYAPILVKEAIWLGQMSGIGRWEGTEQILTYSLDVLYDEVMPATVFVKTLLLYIQNGYSLKEIQKKIDGKIKDFSEEEKIYVSECIREMYRYTPIYHLKGYTRYQIQREERNFSVIEGGKRN